MSLNNAPLIFEQIGISDAARSANMAMKHLVIIGDGTNNSKAIPLKSVVQIEVVHGNDIIKTGASLKAKSCGKLLDVIMYYTTPRLKSEQTFLMMTISDNGKTCGLITDCVFELFLNCLVIEKAADQSKIIGISKVCGKITEVFNPDYWIDKALASRLDRS